ncbi:PREDICTED: Fc receptor-like A isoform X4 [Colobus angolensis palliatus]|uniref:Ig-like domain-containing protein n=1 Tax=Colobus angolensis palliatus TaxID=336983 RepID=A0A2K5JFM5_COLAP|nr:PREDICTED: Fc receptor-like A isoform X4 [Colobus angolensis palliatus]
MLKKIIVGIAGDLNTVTMKLGCVLMAWALYLSLGVLWASQMLLAAGYHAELFPAPILRAIPSAEPQAGGPMTLSCQTKLPLQRSAAHLLFSFYKNGRTVQSRGVSSEFQIPTASEDHSGSYWCEAATEDNQVWKQSPQLEIRVQGPPGSAPLTLNPAPQKSAAPGTAPEEALGPLPPLPAPSSEDPGFSSPLGMPDPHLYHQMGLLLKHMQDMRVLLGHLLMELRELSGHRKPGTTKTTAE